MAAGTGGQYRINLVWTSHGGQVLATMGQIQSGMRQVGFESQRSGRDMGYFNRQMQAIGTTIRYYFAGGAIYGAIQAFQSFSDFQSKLGDIAAISPEFTHGDITQIGDTLLRQSSALAQPVTELEDSARNIQSTLANLNPEQVTEFTDLFARGAMVAETDAYHFGNAIMGMRNAFGLSLNDMGRIADEFFLVVQKSAGMTGDEWANFSGRVVAGAAQAGASLEEMNAITVLMTRQGATAATNMRHLAQFMMQLRNPTQESTPFWEAIGLDVKTLRNAPFDTIMQKLMDAVKKRGGLRRMTTGDIMGMEEGIDPQQMGGGISLLMDLFGRIESRRAAIVVLSQLLNPPKEGADTYKQLLESFEGSTKEADNLDKAVERALSRKRIQQFGIALRNSFTQALNPAETQINRIFKKLGDFAQGHGASAVQVGAGALAAYGLFRGGRGLGRLLRRVGPAGVAVSQAGQGAPNGSFANPLWVMIHPASGMLPGGRGVPGVPGGPTGGPGTGPKTPGKWAGRWARFGSKLARFGGPAAIAGFALMDAEAAGTTGSETAGSGKQFQKMVKSGELSPRFLDFAMQKYGKGMNAQQFAKAVMDNLWVWQQTFLTSAANFAPSTAQLQSAMATEKKMRSYSAVEENRLSLFVDASDEAKRLLKISASGSPRSRVHVPVGHNAWQGGASPGLRGRPKSIRGGN